MKYSIISLLIAGSLLAGCNKTEIPPPRAGSNLSSGSDSPTPQGGGNHTPNTSNGKAILIDASKDGGGWWFPQGPGTGYTAANYHQGKPLVDYLKSLGYQVDELPRGATITSELLSKYSNVIRATAFFDYTPEEINAYETFLARSSSLLLISDHLTYTVNDRLSSTIGLAFEGSQSGPIIYFESHPVTAGVSSLPYIAGAVLRSWDPAKITVLGAFNSLPGQENGSVGVMGIVNHPSSRIFFIGDINGIEQLPQPFTSNLVNWLFR